MISTFQALAVALIAIAPGATYTFVYERHAGAYGTQLSDRFVRFLVASGCFHVLFAWPEFVAMRKLEAHGYAWLDWWHVQLAAAAYLLVPYAIGSLFGRATQRDKRWARWFVGSLRHPRAWDHLWRPERRLIVRVRLASGNYLAGVYDTASDGINSYAAGYGEDADLYLSRQLMVDPETGEFEADSDGRPVFHEPATGLLVRASDVESWHVQEVDHV